MHSIDSQTALCFLTCVHTVPQQEVRWVPHSSHPRAMYFPSSLFSFTAALEFGKAYRVVADIMAFASRPTLCEFNVHLDPCWARKERRCSLPSSFTGETPNKTRLPGTAGWTQWPRNWPLYPLNLLTQSLADRVEIKWRKRCGGDINAWMRGGVLLNLGHHAQRRCGIRARSKAMKPFILLALFCPWPHLRFGLHRTREWSMGD